MSLATASRTFFAACPVCDAAERTDVERYPELTFSRCARCGLLYKSEQDPAFTQAIARKYDASYFQGHGAQYLGKWEHRVAKCRRQLLACLEFAPHARRVLDVGCSAGYVLAAAQSLGLEAAGLDYSPFSAAVAKERGYAAAAGSMTALPFRNASLDIVTAKHTLEHVTPPKQALAEVARVLRPGGVAFLAVPDVGYWRFSTTARRKRYCHPERTGWQHHVYYDDGTLRRALEGAGLEVVALDKALFRGRLARGLGAAWEGVRFGALKVWTTVARWTHTRRELQLIARKPA